MVKGTTSTIVGHDPTVIGKFVVESNFKSLIRFRTFFVLVGGDYVGKNFLSGSFFSQVRPLNK